MKQLKALKLPPASEPSPVTYTDAVAVQALAAGSANEGQQKHALKWILESACGLPVWAFRDTERETAIALGRQFVGQQIIGAMNVNVSRLRKLEEKPNG